MINNLKITTKIISITFLLITISITSVSYIGFHVTKKSIESSKIPALESIADFKVDMIERLFKGHVADIKTAQNYYNIKTNLPIVTQYAKDRTSPAYITAKKMLDDQLNAFQNAYGYIDIMLVSPDGKIVYVTNEAHAEGDLDHYLPCVDEEKTFEAGKKGLYFSNIFRNKLEGYEFEMIVIAPAHDFNERFIGCIAFEIDMEPIYKSFQDTTGLGETGETLIGRRISAGVLFVNPLRHDKEATLNRKVAFGEKSGFPIQEAVQGRNGYGLSTDYRGEEVLAVWRYIPSLDWGLVAKIDKLEAFGLITQMEKVTVVSALVILFFALTGAVFFARSITSPVRKLSDIAHKISQGDMTKQITVKSNDEIGMLARSFDTMRIKVAKLLKDIGEAKQDWESTFDSVRDIIVIYGEDSRIIRCNNELLNRLNVKFEDIIGMRCYEVLYHDEKERNEHKDDCNVLKTIKTKMSYSVERELINLHGIFALTTFPRYNNKGKFVGVVQILRDTTVQKKTQEQLMRSHKMVSLGQQAAGVCHEILNPINIISSHVQLMLMEAEKGSNLEKDAKSIQEEVKRVVNITDGLLRFSRNETPTTENTEVNDLLENVIPIVEHELKLRNIDIIKKLEGELPEIKVNINQLRQVFLNLINNAYAAMPKGGTLTVKTQRIRLFAVGQKPVFVGSKEEKGSEPKENFIEIIFEDSGCGISSENIEKIFNPFFTTKKEGEGTGLGLSESYKIVENHGGKLHVQSRKGKGSTFTIDLPVKI